MFIVKVNIAFVLRKFDIYRIMRIYPAPAAAAVCSSHCLLIFTCNSLGSFAISTRAHANIPSSGNWNARLLLRTNWASKH